MYALGKGLQQYVQRSWQSLQPNEQTSFYSCLRDTLLNRQLARFSRSKVEQVVASICLAATSLQPALELVTDDYSSPQFAVGISLCRTVFDALLGDNCEASPDVREVLMQHITSVAASFTSLICTLFASSGASTTDDAVRGICLELLVVLVCKLPVGGHLSFSVLHCLTSIIEQPGIPTPHKLLAVESLTDVMGKRYIPRDEGRDSGGEVLLSLVVNTVSMLIAIRYMPYSF